VFFTGGEPFIIDEIYEMLAYASQRIQTTVLTNAILLKGRRLEKLVAINHPSLCVQVSLDGGLPQHHDAYRGAGAWQQTVDGIARLQAHGFKIRLSTTETPANKDHLDLLCEFHQSLGIPEEAHLIRPLAARGFSKEGLQVSIDNLSPEVTVNLDGAFWHPLSTAEDMRVSASPFPLSSVVASIKARLEAQTGAPLKTVT
jgi:MoaA/NifB/PqqE/SkfB family radical SAM enzyme